jgi:tetratricopeptide (TPR) repeat protein
LLAEVPVENINEPLERLKFEFSEQTEETAVLALLWEKIKIPFKIAVDLKKHQLEAYRNAMTWGKYYIYWQNMRDAANFCLVNNINLEEGLQWSERSIRDFFGETNFLTLSTYAGLLEKLNRKKEADSAMQKALPMATILQLYSYGGTLVRMKESQRAYEVYKLAYDKSPKDGYALLGMIRGSFAIGDKKAALAFGEQALTAWEDSNSKAFIAKMIEDIKAGKDINK